MVPPCGVVSSPDLYTSAFAANPVLGDAPAGAFPTRCDVGVLGIEFHARLRIRVNGRLESASVDRFPPRVEQSFGNCSLFIHPGRVNGLVAGAQSAA